MNTFFIIVLVFLTLAVITLSVLLYRAKEFVKYQAEALRVLNLETEQLMGEVSRCAREIIRGRQEVRWLTEFIDASKMTVFEQTLEACENPSLVTDLYGTCECGEEYFKDRFAPQFLCRECGRYLEQPREPRKSSWVHAPQVPMRSVSGGLGPVAA